MYCNDCIVFGGDIMQPNATSADTFVKVFTTRAALLLNYVTIVANRWTHYSYMECTVSMPGDTMQPGYTTSDNWCGWWIQIKYY